MRSLMPAPRLSRGPAVPRCWPATRRLAPCGPFGPMLKRPRAPSSAGANDRVLTAAATVARTRRHKRSLAGGTPTLAWLIPWSAEPFSAQAIVEGLLAIAQVHSVMHYRVRLEVLKLRFA